MGFSKMQTEFLKYLFLLLTNNFPALQVRAKILKVQKVPTMKQINVKKGRHAVVESTNLEYL